MDGYPPQVAELAAIASFTVYVLESARWGSAELVSRGYQSGPSGQLLAEVKLRYRSAGGHVVVSSRLQSEEQEVMAFMEARGWAHAQAGKAPNTIPLSIVSTTNAATAETDNPDVEDLPVLSIADAESVPGPEWRQSVVTVDGASQPAQHLATVDGWVLVARLPDALVSVAGVGASTEDVELFTLS